VIRHNTQLEVVDRFVELDARETGDFDISLLWDRATNRVQVLLVDRTTGEVSAIDAAAEDALDAFWHPFLYLAEDHAWAAA
jgi:hypothetical protein